MNIKTVALIGAGAIGAYFISCLQDKLQENLWVVAEGERNARLKKDGLVINQVQYKLNVKSAEEAKGADLVIVGVKYNGLPSVLPMLKTVVAEHTLVISPMNGVDSEAIIEGVIGQGRVLPSYMFISSERAGNAVAFDPERTLGLNIGEADGQGSERIAALEELFAGTAFHYHVKENIIRDIWSKFALNISRNLPQAIINCGQGAYADSEHLEYISQRMRAEVALVAKAKGIELSEAPKQRKINPAARFSTLQDLDAKRETEIDMFSGTLVKMAKELGIEVPFNEFAYHAIKCLEEKNKGIIK